MNNAIDPAEFGISTDRGASTLARLVAVKAQQQALAEEREAIEQALRIELGNNPDPIVDGEHGIVATLKTVNRPASIDLATLATHPDLEPALAEAARAGVLTASLTPLRALRGRTAWADSLLRFEAPGGVHEILQIEVSR